MKKDLSYYMSLPYTIQVIPIPVDEGGGFTAQLPELGKYAIAGDGDTPEEAIRDLDQVKEARFKYYLEKGLSIPEPKSEKEDFSGRFVLRLPKEMHRLLALKAGENQTSLNTYLIYLINYAIGESKAECQFETILSRLELMKDIIWKVDYKKSGYVATSVSGEIEVRAAGQPSSNFSEFKKAA
jgi:predicted HicB family RNase H-like nuclease